MVLGSPAHTDIESSIEARVAAGETLSPAHADHVQQCSSCAQLFDDLTSLAESTPKPSAGLNQRILRAVIADQEQVRFATQRQRTRGVITLTTLRAALVIVVVTIVTFSAGVWAASNLGN
jgi:predicted anti-sigma-YlaC factor YlaD